MNLAVDALNLAVNAVDMVRGALVPALGEITERPSCCLLFVLIRQWFRGGGLNA